MAPDDLERSGDPATEADLFAVFENDAPNEAATAAAAPTPREKFPKLQRLRVRSSGGNCPNQCGRWPPPWNAPPRAGIHSEPS